MATDYFDVLAHPSGASGATTPPSVEQLPWPFRHTWISATHCIVRYYGHTPEWWEQAVKYYKLAKPESDIQDPIPPGFWDLPTEQMAHVIDMDLDVRARYILWFWLCNPGQAELLLPKDT